MTATTPVYANATMAVEDRVADLLAGMEVDEELAQLGAVGFPDLMKGERLDEEAALAVVPRGIGQVARIGATTGLLPARTAELLNEIQRVMIERTRFGVPVMVNEESVGVIARLGRRCSHRHWPWRAAGTPAPLRR
jgi:beta-glucosidase